MDPSAANWLEARLPAVIFSMWPRRNDALEISSGQPHAVRVDDHIVPLDNRNPAAIIGRGAIHELQRPPGAGDFECGIPGSRFVSEVEVVHPVPRFGEVSTLLEHLLQDHIVTRVPRSL